ncbi:hypothetical protein CC86DRAFT_47323 [Ophiobolus disseminans]|uniref:Uncharacterized protein n=1 Tax=Ophiobolus disseminans TaxID=1469910 RepID=A0A6A6ZWR0_9PLEO|nr:hypothetical protein CC86DRAFT_47323 [Ophiobolus disseminans]
MVHLSGCVRTLWRRHQVVSPLGSSNLVEQGLTCLCGTSGTRLAEKCLGAMAVDHMHCEITVYVATMVVGRKRRRSNRIFLSCLCTTIRKPTCARLDNANYATAAVRYRQLRHLHWFISVIDPANLSLAQNDKLRKNSTLTTTLNRLRRRTHGANL